MKVRSRHIGPNIVAQLTGEIDLKDTEGFADALSDLVARRPRALVLDCTEITYIASIGLSLLLKLAQDVRKSGGTLILASVTPAVKTVLDTVHLGAVIPIEPTVEQALSRQEVQAVARA